MEVKRITPFRTILLDGSVDQHVDVMEHGQRSPRDISPWKEA